MTRERPVIQSRFAVLGSAVLRCAVLLFACLAATGCAEDAGEGQLGTQSVALEDDPLDGQCSRIVWEHMPNRYLDAHTSGNGNVVTRTFQDNTTQLWCFTRVDPLFARYTVQHRTFSGQFLDAYGVASEDYRVVLRDAAFSNGAPHLDQVWRLWGRNRLYQGSTQRYLDGHTSSSRDYRAVTRTFQVNDSQNWDIESLPMPLPEDPSSCDPPPTGSAACEPEPPCTPPMGSVAGNCPPPAP